MSESKFKGAANSKFREAGYEVQCFEDKLSCGIADTFVGWDAGGVWIEWKWVGAIPARNATPLSQRILRIFHRRHTPAMLSSRIQ